MSVTHFFIEHDLIEFISGSDLTGYRVKAVAEWYGGMYDSCTAVR